MNPERWKQIDELFDAVLEIPNERREAFLSEKCNDDDNLKSVAFRSEREPRGIYVMGASGENLRRVADFGFQPSWSPDGKEIVVSTFGLDAPSVRVGSDNGLWTVNLETGAKRELLKENATFPTWSPNAANHVS